MGSLLAEYEAEVRFNTGRCHCDREWESNSGVIIVNYSPSETKNHGIQIGVPFEVDRSGDHVRITVGENDDYTNIWGEVDEYDIVESFESGKVNYLSMNQHSL